ncbi:MAG TPA: DinB family protein [Pyrinomonadaceae bacterium]|nr:DinB family protein [Pyrinomonadaceae bacterium]
MSRTYRSGAIGALMDEYERAAAELRRVVEQISDEEFRRVVDSQTKDDDCRSVQTVMSHVVRAVYGYADYIREQFSIASARPQNKLLSHQEVLVQLDAALAYTAQTLEGRWEMSDEEISRTIINSSWGVVYDVEQLLEHAIVHLLRHRRQIEKFMGLLAASPGVS